MMDVGSIKSFFVTTNYMVNNSSTQNSAKGEGEFKVEKSKKREGELSEKEKEELKKLKETDRKVRQHEMAHIMAANGLAVTPAQYQYKRGPDGQLYAVSGEVKIDTSEVPNDPEATIEKAKRIQRCALAPQDPSPQDRQVAAKARQMENKARIELMKKRQKEMQQALKREGNDQQSFTMSEIPNDFNSKFISKAYNASETSGIINFLV